MCVSHSFILVFSIIIICCVGTVVLCLVIIFWTVYRVWPSTIQSKFLDLEKCAFTKRIKNILTIAGKGKDRGRYRYHVAVALVIFGPRDDVLVPKCPPPPTVSSNSNSRISCRRVSGGGLGWWHDEPPGADRRAVQVGAAGHAQPGPDTPAHERKTDRQIDKQGTDWTDETE